MIGVGSALDIEQLTQLAVDAGIATDKAKYVVDLLDGITGTGSWDIDAKKYTVRDIDKREAIAKASPLPTLICGSLYLYADLPKELRSI